MALIISNVWGCSNPVQLQKLIRRVIYVYNKIPHDNKKPEQTPQWVLSYLQSNAPLACIHINRYSRNRNSWSKLGIINLFHFVYIYVLIVVQGPHRKVIKTPLMLRDHGNYRSMSIWYERDGTGTWVHILITRAFLRHHASPHCTRICRTITAPPLPKHRTCY
jgi:hypothetical protein